MIKSKRNIVLLYFGNGNYMKKMTDNCSDLKALPWKKSFTPTSLEFLLLYPQDL